ncbi:hypothetical protein HDU99_001829, partial [Rhizoclosmatium hyalinum]
YAEVFDDNDAEEPAAIVGLYEMDDVEFAPLLRFAIHRDNIHSSAAVIVLDWSKPWLFMEKLEKYLGVLGKAMAGEATPEDRKQSSEPDVSGNTLRFNSTTLDASMAAHSVTLPLGQGVLTNNLGIPIIVVCSKSDMMATLEREHGYGEGTFDYIQQTLRTICLKYGASLFYTSIFKPKTIDQLRTFILHKLLRSSETALAFPFPYRPEVIDRELVRVPAGWDNWGLIKVQGNGFSCEAMAGWESGVEPVDGDVSSLAMGRALYESEIKNPGSSRSKNSKPLVLADEEQVFLERNLELLNTMSTGNASVAGSPYTMPSESFSNRFANSTSSGAASSSDMLEDVSQKLAKLAKLKEQSASAALRNKLPMTGLNDASPNASFTAPGSPSPLPSSSTFSNPANSSFSSKPAVAGSNNEVLSNFFQSLLNKKSGGAAAGGGSPIQAARSTSMAAKPYASPLQPPAMLASSSAGGTSRGKSEVEEDDRG